MSDFDTFWARYPRRVAKGAARKAWEKAQRLEPNLLALCIAALDWQTRQDQWTRDGGQFIPYPGTYLHQERWTDENPQLAVQAKQTTQDAADAAYRAMRARVEAEEAERLRRMREGA